MTLERRWRERVHGPKDAMDAPRDDATAKGGRRDARGSGLFEGEEAVPPARRPLEPQEADVSFRRRCRRF
jgi:hypothetical protein